MEENDEEKEEEQMDWKKRDEEETQDGLVFEEGIMVPFPWSPFLESPSPAYPVLRFFPPRRS